MEPPSPNQVFLSIKKLEKELQRTPFVEEIAADLGASNEIKQLEYYMQCLKGKLELILTKQNVEVEEF